MDVARDVSLREWNTFGVEARAARYAEWSTAKELAAAWLAGQGAMGALLLGGGSNILFTRDFDGLVLRARGGRILEAGGDADTVGVVAEAGVVWDSLVDWACARGWGGVENLAGIPGTVGAAPVQNIGAYGAELADVLESVAGLRLPDLTPAELTAAECALGYRDSVFKGVLRGRFAITAVRLRLRRQPVPNLSYEPLRQSAAGLDPAELTPGRLRDQVRAIRAERLPDPAVWGNAGSFFRNPVLDAAAFGRLRAAHPDVASFPLPGGGAKVAAGWLIERCGWKGAVRGRVGVHHRQALVLVNRGGATGRELAELAEAIRATVTERFGITLQPEVVVI